MKRSPPPKRYTPLKRRAKPGRTSQYAIQLNRQRRAVDRRCYGKCEFKGCQQIYDHIHHMHRRSQGGTNHLSNLMAVCIEHHTWIHANVREAFELGYLKRESLPYED